MTALKGDIVSATVPVLGALLGLLWMRYSLDNVCHNRNVVALCMLLMGICVIYGCAGANVIIQSAPGYAGLAAGLVNGVSAALTAVSVGVFGAKAAECSFQNPRIFVGGVLILIFIMAIGVYGLIVAVTVASSAKNTKVDMVPDTVLWFAFNAILANLGALFGSVVSGISIMEIGVGSPKLVMKAMISTIMVGVIGIYGLLDAMVGATPVSWPPRKHDAVAGLFYIVASLGLAFFAFTGVQRLPRKASALPSMLLKMMACQTIGFVGLAFSLIKHGMKGEEMPHKTETAMQIVKGELSSVVQESDTEAAAIAIVGLIGIMLASNFSL